MNEATSEGDGLNAAGVSQAFEMSPAAIRQHRSRILRRLRQQLD